MSKIGRNNDCPCGSGEKYKKCCLSRNIIIPKQPTNKVPKSEKILIKTLTDELFQPMRLYYIVHNRELLEASFRKLKCFEYNEKLNDWVLEYANEAANIGLAVAPNQVPKEAQPLLIATIYIENETTMFVDVRSIERAKKLILFINKYVPKNIAEITHAAIYNQLITVSSDNAQEGINDIDYDTIFNQRNIFVVDPEKVFRDAEELAKKYQDKDERLQAMMLKTREDSKKLLPKVEKFPVYFYEEGIDQFAMTCQMRQVIAMKHFYGDVNYSFFDLTQEFLNKNQEKSLFNGGWVKKSENIISN